MRIIRFMDEYGHTHRGRDLGDGSGEILTGPLDALTSTGDTARVKRLLAPVQPPNIFCIGLNYRAHAAESNSPIPETPVLFMKPTTALANPGDAIRIPLCTQRGPEVDYEVELAVVIAKEVRNAPVEEALDCVLGYTVANDVSARRWQRHNGGQWIRGKGFDTFCPLGPVIVTAGLGEDEIRDPQNLRLKTTVNDQVLQDSSTSDMIFSVAQIISFLSMDTTLLPGTVILTGTPPGVGFARKPPVWLSQGDTVSVEVERIGSLCNPVTAAE